MTVEQEVTSRAKPILSNQCVMFATCLTILLLRAWPRLAHAHLWAEDGATFFPDATAFGLTSIWRPHAGYYQLFPRVVAYLASLLHFRHFARVTTAACFLLCAFVTSVFYRRCYRELVPSDVMRAAVCIAMCGAPGLFEVLGNLANTHNILIIFTGLVALRPMGAPLMPIDWCLAMFALGSDGAGCVWIPSLIIRLILTEEPRCRRPDLLLLFMAIAWTGLHSQALHADRTFETEIPRVRELCIGIFYVTPERLVMLPLIGRKAAMYAMLHKEWLCVAYLPLLAACVAITRHYRRRALLIAAVVTAPLGIYVATWIARIGSLQMFLKGDGFFYHIRYALVIAPFALIFWACALSSRYASDRMPRAQTVCFSTLLVWIALLQPPRDFALGPAIGGRTDWRQAALHMEAARQSASCEELKFPCNPPGWEVTYRPSHRRCLRLRD